jgi:hypothetical protein
MLEKVSSDLSSISSLTKVLGVVLHNNTILVLYYLEHLRNYVLRSYFFGRASNWHRLWSDS